MLVGGTGVRVGVGVRVTVDVGVVVGVHVAGKGCRGVDVGNGVIVGVLAMADTVAVGNATIGGLNGLNKICGFINITA